MKNGGGIEFNWSPADPPPPAPLLTGGEWSELKIDTYRPLRLFTSYFIWRIGSVIKSCNDGRSGKGLDLLYGCVFMAQLQPNCWKIKANPPCCGCWVDQVPPVGLMQIWSNQTKEMGKRLNDFGKKNKVTWLDSQSCRGHVIGHVTWS